MYGSARVDDGGRRGARADVDRDTAHPVVANTVKDGVRASAIGRLAHNRDEAGALEARDHLCGGRLREPGEFADPVPGERTVLEKQREGDTIVASTQPARCAGCG